MHAFPSPESHRHQKRKKNFHVIAAQNARAIGDLDSETFRLYGHQMVEWIAAYSARDALAQHRTSEMNEVVSTPELARQALMGPPPRHAAPLPTILADVETLLIPALGDGPPGSTGQRSIINGGLFPAASRLTILADFLASALGADTGESWQARRTLSALEQVTLEWLRSMMELPDHFVGTLHERPALGTFTALTLARAISLQQTSQAGPPGTEGTRLRLYASCEAHPWIQQVAFWLGLAQDGVCWIETDQAHRLSVEVLTRRLAQDRAAGWHPLAVIATVGTTTTGTIDPIAHLARLCEEQRLWLHIDATTVGALAIDPRKRWILAGCTRAHSLLLHAAPLFAGQEHTILYTHREAMRQGYEGRATLPMPLTQGNETPEGNGSFRIISLWMLLRYFGQDGLIARVREQARLASLLSGWMDKAVDVERLTPTLFHQVCFRAHPFGCKREADLEAINQQLLRMITATGRFHLSPTRIHGKLALRIAWSDLHLIEEDVAFFWNLVQAAIATIKGGRQERPAQEHIL